jgi:YegS/Rv2252/BmrU family lipid kinase
MPERVRQSLTGRPCPVVFERKRSVKKLSLIMNPNAGTRQGRRFIADILTIFSDAGYLPTVFLTKKHGDADEFAEFYSGKADLVVACGGDGTLNEVISGLLAGGHAVPVGYIPCGSTNDFANGLGISTNVLQAARDIAAGEPRPLDIGFFGPDRYFTYIASFGLFASVSYSTSQAAKNVLGHAAYILEGIRSLADVRPVHLKITANDREYEADYLFGAVCNSTSLGGVLKLDNKAVHMSDGLFEALLIPFPEDLLALNRVLSALGAKNYNDPSLIFIRSSRFLIEAEPGIHWSLDGEQATASGLQEIANLHRAIRIVSSGGANKLNG